MRRRVSFAGGLVAFLLIGLVGSLFPVIAYFVERRLGGEGKRKKRVTWLVLIVTVPLTIVGAWMMCWQGRTRQYVVAMDRMCVPALTSSGSSIISGHTRV